MVVYMQTMDSDEDKSKFESIYRAYKNLLFNLAFEKLDNELDAEDLVHNVFLKIVENIKNIEPVSARTKRLVITIFENLAVDTYRSNVVRQEKAAEQTIETVYEAELYEPRVTECIMKLPQKQRDLIWLKHSLGYKNSEIAQMMNVSVAWIQKNEQRAKRKLAQLYEAEGGQL